jgi:hypothetical protein
VREEVIEAKMTTKLTGESELMSRINGKRCFFDGGGSHRVERGKGDEKWRLGLYDNS